MVAVSEMRNQLLRDGRITQNEVNLIRQFIHADNVLDYEDTKFLVGLMKEADFVCDEFDELLFPVLRYTMLEDGRITPDEQYLLLQMLYGDGVVRESERQFIAELYQDVEHMTPEFRALCGTAMSCAATNWSLD